MKFRHVARITFRFCSPKTTLQTNSQKLRSCQNLVQYFNFATGTPKFKTIYWILRNFDFKRSLATETFCPRGRQFTPCVRITLERTALRVMCGHVWVPFLRKQSDFAFWEVQNCSEIALFHEISACSTYHFQILADENYPSNQ